MRPKELTFGSYIEQKRKEREYTLRGFAAEVSLHPSYWSDIEKDRRNPPMDKLEDITRLLKLTEEETAKMYDLAAMARERSVSADLTDYIMGNEMLRVALRRTKADGWKNKDWKRFVEQMNDD